MLYSMKRIRMVQNHIESLYLQDEMKTPVHLCTGQEAISAGVCLALEKDDYITSNHRGHGHYLAKGGSLKALIAELHCKTTGCSKGYGGSMHIVDTAIGHMGSSSIVGGGIPIGTGLGLSILMQEQNRASVIFFGDGASDEGVLYESINFAILKKLPVIYVLENNQWSVCSHVSARQADKNVFHHLPERRLWTKIINGNDVLDVYSTACKAVSRAKNGEGPCFLECRTYRILGHAGCKSQDPEGYRDKNEIEDWEKKCPIINFQEQLLKAQLISEADVADMENQIQIEIDDAFDYATKSPLPDSQKMYEYLYKV